jgi:hypothetical protein
VADAANAGRIGLEAAATARTVGTVARIAEGIATFRAAHPVLHAGAVAITVGGTVAGANHLTKKAFGDSGVTNFVAVASNFIPVGAGAKVSTLASNGRRAALIGEEGLSLSRGVSWAAIREGLSMGQLVGHARFYGPQFAMAGVQVGGSIVAVPWAARKLGLERSEFAQAAMNVALGAIVTSGFAGGMHRLNRTAASNATAERLVEGLGSVRETQIPEAQRTQMQQAAFREIDAFQRNTHNRMPTVEEVAGLRTRLAERLGVDPNTQTGRGQMQLIEGTVEGLRVQRAGELGIQQAIREQRTGPGANNRERVGAMITPDEFHPGRPPTRDVVQRAVELAGERLYQARGGAEGGASRLQAYRDAAQQIAGTLHAQALHQVQNHGRSEFSEALVRGETYAGDRVSAVEMTARLQTPGPNGQPPVIGSREAARLEPFLAGEINRARAVLEQTPANGNMREHWNNLRQRLIDEVGLSPTAADTTMRTMQADLFQQTAVRRVIGAQVAAGEARPLSNAEIMNQARDTATRMGFNQNAAEVLARDLAQSRPQLEEAGFIRRGGETQNEAAFRRFRSENPALADQFLQLTPDQFVRAFGEAPNPDRLAVLANDPQFVALAAANPAATHRIMMNGPDPILAPPQPNAVMAARAELATLRPGERLSDASADVLMQDVVNAARASLLEDHRQLRPQNANMNEQTAFSCGEMANWCGFGQALTHHRLVEMGIPENRLHARQAADIFGRDSFNHAFMVVEMQNGKLYLVDTTFRQFFDGPTGQNNIGRPGSLMRQSERGSRIADQLLERGYVELTAEVAQEYGRALSGNPNSRFTVADYMNARRLPIDFTRAEQPNLAAVPALNWEPGVASAGRPVQLNPAEQVHVGVGDFRAGGRFDGGGHEYTNVAALEAQGYQRTDRSTLIRYRDALVAHRQADQALRTWHRADRATRGPRPPHPGQEPRPADFGLTSEKVYFIERNGNAWVGGIFPAGNRIHHDGHTWFPSNWDQGHVQQAANLLAREGPTVERTNQPSVVKLSAWMRIGQDGRVEMAPAGLADPVAQGYLRVGMLVPTDPAAGRTVFAEMRQR